VAFNSCSSFCLNLAGSLSSAPCSQVLDLPNNSSGPGRTAAVHKGGGAPRGAERRPEIPDADSFALNRFVTAQAPVFTTALEELKAGRKRSHWMWFVFPQLRGLGHSAMAEFYGISSLAEARAYLAHPVLGPKLILCTETVLALQGQSLHAIFGSPDDLKFCSSMTLFSLATGEGESAFRHALDRYCDGRLDERTLALCQMGAG
jgi:uncharacterized protein (DUF1810 family)